MIDPMIRVINTLDSQLALLQKKSNLCKEQITFQDLYFEDDEEVTGYWNNSVVNYLNATLVLDDFCSSATKARQVFCRKFAKYSIDRSHYQKAYDDILDDLIRTVSNNAIKVLNHLDKIPEEKFEDRSQHATKNIASKTHCVIERVADDIYKAMTMYQDRLIAQRKEWPVIPKYKNRGNWHNRGIRKNVTRT